MQITKKSTRVGKGVRVKVQRCTLLHALPRDSKKEVMSSNDGNRINYHGRVVSGIGNQVQKIELDEFPVGFKVVLVRKRDRIMVVEDGEDKNSHTK